MNIERLIMVIWNQILQILLIKIKNYSSFKLFMKINQN